MIKRFALRLLLLLLGGGMVSPLYSANSDALATEQPARVESAEKATNVFHPIAPGPTDGRIAWVTALMLGQLHYTTQRFDAVVSSKFLDHYLDTLDPYHMHFTQADLAQFEHYRTNLDRLTLNRAGQGDTRPACEIFNRFVERFQQHVQYVDNLLKSEKFTFDSDERIVINRHELPYPKDINEAQQLWRERLRAEYLQEKLGKLDAKKRSQTAPGAEAPGKGSAAAAVTNSPARPKSEAEEIVETLSRRYHRNLHATLESNDDDVLQIYLTTLAHVYDPHSDYFGRPQLESFAIGMNLSLFGIGAELSPSEEGYCTIRRLLPGGPAIKSKKIKENDRIVAVAQSNQPPVDIIDMSLNKAVQLIRGPKGTEVRLTLIPAGADSGVRTVVSLIRDEIALDEAAAKAKVIDLPNDHGQTVRVGVIDLPSFYAPFDVGGTHHTELAKANDSGSTKSTTADVSKLITKLKQENVKGIVLDLRYNGGGSLDEAIRLTGLFIKDGPVVQVRSAANKIEVDPDPDSSILYDGPLIVLTSRLSASASEILAGALQDYGRALIVGDISTHGKGTVQMVNQLRPAMQLPESVLTNDPGALKITIKKFYRPSGASTQKRGVIPDIILPSVRNEYKDIGEGALDGALGYDTIPSAKYDQLNEVAPYLPNLLKRSAQRIAADPEFNYIREDIELVRKQQADKTVSLNEKQRLKEKEEDDARHKARDKERLARQEPQEKVYELSLKQASLPGLPPPVQKTNSALAKLSGAKGAAVVGEGTNSAVAAVATPAPTLSDEAEEEKAPVVDATLDETEHILVDYLTLLSKNNVAAMGR
jgi:carboxyl-terminal processing protease